MLLEWWKADQKAATLVDVWAVLKVSPRAKLAVYLVDVWVDRGVLRSRGQRAH